MLAFVIHIRFLLQIIELKTTLVKKERDDQRQRKKEAVSHGER